MNPRQIIEKLKIQEKTVLVATSAGSDSMALLDGLYRNAVNVVACYIDHQQRPEENAEEKRLLQDYCKTRRIQLLVQPIDLSACNQADNQQAFFREQRYQILTKQAEALGISTIATGHHQDDQAETQLMRLIKNYDVLSYTGILPVQQLTEQIKLIRPLLDVRKADIIEYCEKYNVPFVQDSSNMSAAYFRNRVRNETMPIFEAENQHFVPEFIEKMTDFVAYQQYLQEQLQKTMTQELPLTNVVEQEQLVAFLAQYDGSLQKLAIPVFLHDFLGYNGKIKQEKVKEIRNTLLTNPSKMTITLDEDTSLGIQYGKIFLLKADEKEPENISMRITLGENIIGSYHVICSTEEAIASDPWKTIILPEQVFEKGIYLRSPEKSDYLPLKDGKKRLNRLYIDEKVLPHERFRAPVLTDSAHAVIYDVITGKVGFFAFSSLNDNMAQTNVYLHIKKRTES